MVPGPGIEICPIAVTWRSCASFGVRATSSTARVLPLLLVMIAPSVEYQLRAACLRPHGAFHGALEHSDSTTKRISIAALELHPIVITEQSAELGCA
jgi:hypothetical protein